MKMSNPYFGAAWDAPICENSAQAETPVGVPCSHCALPIVDGDRGIIMAFAFKPGPNPIHRECMIRNVVGCLNRLQGRSCDCATRPLGTPAEEYMDAVAVYNFLQTTGTG